MLYITLQQDESFNGKTKKFFVFSKLSHAYLGIIKWYSPWRRYCFFPDTDTLYDRFCMVEISQALHDLMQQRNVKK